MKRFKDMSLKQAMHLLGVANVAAVAILACVFFRMAQSAREVGRDYERQYSSYLLAEELRQSSDDLTRASRSYAATGIPAFEQQYNDVLAIRNGEKPRPQGYNRIYWDFVNAGNPKPRPDTVAIPLRTLMEDAGFTLAELDLLDVAQRNSDGLVMLEVQAMNAVKGRFDDGMGGYTKTGEPDLALARNLLFSNEYLGAKARIMKPIDDFYVMFTQRLAEGVEASNAVAQRWAIVTGAVITIMILLTVLTLRVVSRRVLSPVQKLYQAISAMAAGDLDADFELATGKDEVGAIGHNLLSFRDALKHQRALEVEISREREARVQAETEQRALEAQRRVEHAEHEREMIAAKAEKIVLENLRLDMERVKAEQLMEMRTAFLATMSHEIRTPINGILGMLELVAPDGLDDSQWQSIRIALQSAKTLQHIVNDILDFSKIDAGKMEIERVPMSVPDVCHDVVEMARSLVPGKSVSLECVLDPQIAPVVMGDPVRVRQIILNLVSNAVKFTSDERPGRVRINVSSVAQGSGACRLLFEVVDNGVGMGPEILTQLFKPFSQAHSSTTRKFGGTGLGLSICKRLTEMMGGVISVESVEGEGSTFRVILPFEIDAERKDSIFDPRSRTQAIRPQLAPLSVAEAVAENRLILVADDNPTNCLVIIRQLRHLGYAAEAVSDGNAVLEAWSTGRYRLLITDLHMPKMGGLELTAIIRRREAEVAPERRAIILGATADAFANTRTLCEQAGMDAVMTKPVELAILHRVMNQWLPLGSRPPKIEVTAEQRHRQRIEK